MAQNQFKFFASLDIDFFACQVWSQPQLTPSLKDHPLIIYDEKSGHIISVNNLAVDREGNRLSRNQTFKQALQKAANPSAVKCFPVPLRFGKSSQLELRTASHQIQDCVESYIKTHEPLITVKKTMKDEIGLDITEAVLNKIGQPFDLVVERPVSWIPNEETATERDRIAAKIVSSLLEELETSTGFHASAGVGPSLIVAKLARERNKPRGLTVVPSTQLDELYKQVRLVDAPEFRGFRGQEIQDKILKDNNAYLYSFKTVASQFTDGKAMYKKHFSGFDKMKFNEKVCITLWHIGLGLDEELTNEQSSFSASYFVQVEGNNYRAALHQVFSYAAEEMREILQEERQRKNRTPRIIKFEFKWKGKRPDRFLPINFSINPTNKEDFGLNFQEIDTLFEVKIDRNIKKANCTVDDCLSLIEKLTVVANF